MSFQKLDSLDKFVTIFMKFIDQEIETTTDAHLQNIFITEKEVVKSTVELVRYLDSLTLPQLVEELRTVGEDVEMAEYLNTLCQQHPDVLELDT